jgi:hypothetical protein
VPISTPWIGRGLEFRPLPERTENERRVLGVAVFMHFDYLIARAHLEVRGTVAGRDGRIDGNHDARRGEPHERRPLGLGVEQLGFTRQGVGSDRSRDASRCSRSKRDRH